MPTTSPDALAEFEEGLRSVIGLLDGPNGEAAAIEQAVERLGRLFAALRATSNGSTDVEHRALADALSRTAGLNAVAQQLVLRRLDLVGEQIVLSRQLQNTLDRSCEADNTGGYCDVER